jgi:ATPase subunit of ABC transporter with duplicated ATPase domains
VEILTPLTIALPPSGLPSSATVLALDSVIAEFGDRRLGPWTLHINGPERAILKGPNGAGKTNLLQVAAGLLAPVAGTVRRAEGRIAMLDQHVGLLERGHSILDNVRRLNPKLSEEDATLSARTLLSGIVMRADRRHAVRGRAPAGRLGCKPRRFNAAMAHHYGRTDQSP